MTANRFATPDSPYKGLAAFAENDALFFFGRERDTEVIAANALAARFTILYGPLGAGKSSVLRAGVLHRIRTLAPDALVVAHDEWAGNPLVGLLDAVSRAGAGGNGLGTAEPLADTLANVRGRTRSELILVLDQFEEAFVYPATAKLVSELAEVVTRPGLGVNVLIALREDALAELDVFTGRIPNVFGNYLALDRLDRAAARLAITGPLERYNGLSAGPGMEIEPELVDAVLDDVGSGRVGLQGFQSAAGEAAGDGGIEAPYLQLVMQRIWDAERERGSRVLRRATLDELGGAEAIVGTHLQTAMGSLAPSEQDVAGRVFNHVVTPSGTKVAHRLDDLAEYADVSEDELRPVVDALSRRRILRPVDGRFEIFHDVLAAAVLDWRRQHDADRQLELERAAAERRQRRLVVLLASALVALAAVSAIAIYAFSQRAAAHEQARIARDEAVRADARALAADAGALIPVTPAEIDPELGLLLAAKAARLDPSARAADTLRRALLVSELRAILPDRRVSTASYSPDGSRIAVVRRDGRVRVYTADTRKPIVVLEDTRPITAASFDPTRNTLLTTERDGPARSWNLAAGTPRHTFGTRATHATFDDDGSLVLTIRGRRVRIWRSTGGAPVSVLRVPAAIQEAFFGRNGRVFVAAGRAAWVFDGLSGVRLAVARHGSAVSGLAVSSDGRRLVTIGNGSARLWGLHGGARLERELSGLSSLTAAAISPDGDLLATTSADTTTRIWALPSGQQITRLIGHKNRVNGAEFSSDGSSLLTWSNDGTARVWDPQTGAARVVLAAPGGPVSTAAFDRSGEHVLTVSQDGRARLWRSRVDSELGLVAKTERLTAAAFSGDGRVAAVAGKDDVELLDTLAGDPLTVIPMPGVSAIAMNADGSLLAAPAGSHVAIWSKDGSKPVGEIDAPDPVTAVAVNARGDRVGIGTAQGAIEVRTVEGELTASVAERKTSVADIAFDPDSNLIAGAFRSGELGVWAISKPRPLWLRRVQSVTTLVSVAFSARGTRLVTTGSEGSVRVWSAATGESYPLRGHSGVVSDGAFSPNGQWLVTASPEIAGLWDLASRQRFLFLTGAEGKLEAVSFAAGGLAILTLGSDGKLGRYACRICGDVSRLLRLADERLAATGRTLTPRERNLYLRGGL